MNDFLNNAWAFRMDEMDSMLDDFELRQEDYARPGSPGLSDPAFLNPHVPAETMPRLHASPHDHLLDDQGLLFDAFEAWQETHREPVPEPWPAGTSGANRFVEPDVGLRIASEGRPSPAFQEDAQYHRMAPTEPPFVRRPMWHATGATRASSGHTDYGKAEGVRFWCVKLAQPMTEPDTEACEDCEEACIHNTEEQEWT